jgi:hypothetical protein
LQDLEHADHSTLFACHFVGVDLVLFGARLQVPDYSAKALIGNAFRAVRVKALSVELAFVQLHCSAAHLFALRVAKRENADTHGA